MNRHCFRGLSKPYFHFWWSSPLTEQHYPIVLLVFGSKPPACSWHLITFLHNVPNPQVNKIKLWCHHLAQSPDYVRVYYLGERLVDLVLDSLFIFSINFINLCRARLAERPLSRFFSTAQFGGEPPLAGALKFLRHRIEFTGTSVKEWIIIIIISR